MKLDYILQNLTFGELKQMGVGGFEEGAVQPENYREVVGHINLALQNLYTRFPIQEKELALITQLDVVTYRLHSTAAISINPAGYIQDSIEVPFEDDILRINAVYDSVRASLPLNDINLLSSIFTPSFDTLQIGTHFPVDTLINVAYRCTPKTIEVPEIPSELNLKQEVYLPETLLEPLLVYVAYRITKGQGGELNAGLANVAKQHYERLCTEVETRNLLNNAGNVSNIKPELRGFV